MTRLFALALGCLLCGTALSTTAIIPQTSPATTPAMQAPPEVLAAFMKNVDAYVALHRKAEGTLPRLPDKATPEQITQSRVALAALIRAGRPGVPQGNLVTPDMQAYIRRLMVTVFEGPDGATLKTTVMEENPGTLTVKVYDTYPPDVPLTTMPPAVLAALPKLPEEIRYGFVGRALVLLDEHADIIVDFVPDAFPG